MKSKGFTLVELLAVIVILSIILLIAIPVLVNVIDNARDKSIISSAENYLHGAELAVSRKSLNEGKVFKPSKCIVEDSVMTCAGEEVNMEIKGRKPDSGVIIFEEGKIVSAKLIYGDKIVKKETGRELALNAFDEETIYQDGEIVYFDVATGKACDNYVEANSATGYNGIDNKTGNQNSCLKFYAYNDNGAMVNLILDHNTTAITPWVTLEDYVAAGGLESEWLSTEYTSNGAVLYSGLNTYGPITAINQLKIDTANWKGSLKLDNYTVNQANAGNYTIDYSDANARLITANEVMKIVGYEEFDEETFVPDASKSDDKLYFNSKENDWYAQSDTCKVGNTSGCKFGWLYDRTGYDCTARGCANNKEPLEYRSVLGYWTSTSVIGATSNKHAGAVTHTGTFDPNHVRNNPGSLGIRPVIEVLKSKLTEENKITFADAYIDEINDTISGKNVKDMQCTVNNGNLSCGSTTVKIKLDVELPSAGVVAIANNKVAYVEGLTYGSEKISSTLNGKLKYLEYREVCYSTTGTISTDVGTSYTCEVKPGTSYNFFVVGSTTDKVNLIMDRNINNDGSMAVAAFSKSNTPNGKYSLLPWITESDYVTAGGTPTEFASNKTNKGPVTLMNFLNEATSDWTNLDNLNETITTNEYTMQVTGKARLPKREEVAQAANNLWLLDYLDNGSFPITGRNGIGGMWGYWTLTSAGQVGAVRVYANGNVESFPPAVDARNGVRPVITVSLNNIH